MPQKTQLHCKPELVASTALAEHQIKIILAEGIMLDDQVFLPRNTEQELMFRLQSASHVVPLYAPTRPRLDD
jgi:hypothetical protein